MPKFGLNRQQLKAFLPDHLAIVAFEKMQDGISAGLPSTVEEANANAEIAIAAAQEALSALVEVADELAFLLGAPRVQVGTMGEQNGSNVDITGGTIGLDAGTVGAPSFYLVDTTTGLYRPSANTWGMSIAGVNLVTYSATGAVFSENVSTAKQLISTLPTGTPPLVVSSSTLVGNLYVARAVTADNLGAATSYPADATDLATVITLANAIKAANIAKGV